jgi:hypothetical protein
MKKIMFLVILAFVFILFGCGGGSGGGDNPSSAKEITSLAEQTAFSAGSDQNKLVTDDDFSQEATGVEGTGTTTYESSNTAVATVDTDGLVHIAGAGTAEIIAVNSGDETYNAASDSYLLTVRLPEFITYWQTDDDGQITIPVLSDETEPYEYDYSIEGMLRPIPA